MASPLTVTEYINQVLVPEVCIRLISEDFEGITLEEAKGIMRDSVEFGMFLHSDVE